MKECRVCQESKSVEEFFRTNANKSGYESICKKCKRLESDRAKILCAEPDCAKRVNKRKNSTGFCQVHSMSGDRHYGWKGGRTQGKNGYIQLSGIYWHPNANRAGQIAEHVFLMAEQLGRPLLKDESVHHKNTIRSDNNMSNLELWSGGQPKGARVEDLLKYYITQIELYRGEFGDRPWFSL